MASMGAANVARRKLAALLHQARHLALTDHVARRPSRGATTISPSPARLRSNNDRGAVHDPLPVHHPAQHHGHAGHVVAARHAFFRRADRGADRGPRPAASTSSCNSPPRSSRRCHGGTAYRRCMSRSFEGRTSRLTPFFFRMGVRQKRPRRGLTKRVAIRREPRSGFPRASSFLATENAPGLADRLRQGRSLRSCRLARPRRVSCYQSLEAPTTNCWFWVNVATVPR